MPKYKSGCLAPARLFCANPAKTKIGSLHHLSSKRNANDSTNRYSKILYKLYTTMSPNQGWARDTPSMQANDQEPNQSIDHPKDKRMAQ